MKGLLILITVLIGIQTIAAADMLQGQAVVQNQYNYTNTAIEPKIVEALNLLANNGYGAVVEDIQARKFRVIFYKFSELKVRGNHYSTRRTSRSGNRYIIIDEQFKQSSPEALACLIARESVYKQSTQTVSEEAMAISLAIHVWNKLSSPGLKRDNIVAQIEDYATCYDPKSAQPLRQYVLKKGFNVYCGGA